MTRELGLVGVVLGQCGSCGAKHHHVCATENKWLAWIGDKDIDGRRCFDCWLLEASLKGTVHPLQLQPYYKQLQDWSRISLSPFSIGAILSMSALSLQAVCKTTQRRRLAPASGKCKTCKKGGELLACCFCAALYHNCEVCLPQATLSSTLAASACFTWACPACFKKGVASIQRTVLKPTGQRPAGAMKAQKKRKRKA